MHCNGKRAVDVNATARVGRDRDLEPGLATVDRRREHAKVGGEPAQRDASKSGFFEVTHQTGRRAMVVLEESRIGVDRRSEALSEHELGMRYIEIGMEGCSSRALHAVVGPQDLLAIRDIDRVEGLLAEMRAGKG